MSIFPNLKKDLPEEIHPESEFNVDSNGPEFSEDTLEGLANDGLTATDVPSSALRRSTDKTPCNDVDRGRRSSDRTRPIINKILSGESMAQILFSLTDELKNIFDC